MLKKLRVVGLILILVVGSLFAGITAPVAADSLPKPNDKGDYIGNSSHAYWQVVDPDPQGLNCRMGEQSIKEIWSPDNPGFPPIGSWPVVSTLSENEVFEGQLSYGGFVFTFDQNRDPWIFIKNKSDGTPANCFVRANNLFVQPVEEPIAEEPESTESESIAES
ncbi:MAG: hypothetical protein ACP5D7_07885 [Limnospira sp.]